MTDYPVASDLSHEVFERRRLRGELGPCLLDSTNQKLHPIPCAVVQREAFAADRTPILDGFQGEVVQQRKLAREGF